MLCFPLHLQNQFLSITLVPILIIPFSLSLSLSLSTFVSFFLLLQKFVFYVSFCGKIRAKFCFAKFDRNPKPKPKGKGKDTKTKQRSSREREYVCCFLLTPFFFFWVEIFSARKNGYHSISLVSQNFLHKIAIPNRLMIIVSFRFW